MRLDVENIAAAGLNNIEVLSNVDSILTFSTDHPFFVTAYTSITILLGWLIKGAINGRIKHHYNVKLEKHKKSALVAELLAEWVSDPEDRKKIHHLYWEACLWLPDEELKQVNSLLTKSPNSQHEGPSTKSVLIDIRKLMQGKTALKAADIVHFNPKNPCPECKK